MLRILIGIVFSTFALGAYAGGNCPQFVKDGSELIFPKDHWPKKMNALINEPPTHIAISPKVGDGVSDLCDFEGKHFKNGTFDVYGFREGVGFSKVCTVTVDDQPQFFLRKRKYCVRTQGKCSVVGAKDIKDPRAYISLDYNTDQGEQKTWSCQK